MRNQNWLLGLLLLIFLVNPLQAQTEPTLRELGEEQGIRMGAGVSHYRLFNTQEYIDVVTSQYGLITPTTEFKMYALQPVPGQFDFTQTDEIMAFAQEHDLDVVAHTLLWHEGSPEWLENRVLSREEAIAILEEHISTVVGRYEGQIYAWDVVNEAISRDGSMGGTIWYDAIGPEYIAMAFRMAREADPNALLIYNDYDIETNPAKAEGIYQLVRSLVEAGVPIDAVGMQLHIAAWEDNDWDAVRMRMEQYAALGLQVKITEMDVQIEELDMSREEALELQAQIYYHIMSLCVEIEACTSFTTWGFSDANSWVNQDGLDAPLPFGLDYQPKPAFYALQDALLGEQ